MKYEMYLGVFLLGILLGIIISLSTLPIVIPHKEIDVIVCDLEKPKCKIFYKKEK